MLNLPRIVLAAALANLKSRRELALENVALRQQLAVLARGTKRPKDHLGGPSVLGRPQAMVD